MNIITLQGGGYSSKINLSRGANCISLREDAHGVCALREPDYSAPLDNPYLYGMPILFPVNRIYGGSFSFEGCVYDFGINEAKTGCHLHGDLHEKEFECIRAENDLAECRYSAQEYGGVQQSFTIELSYSLSESGLTQRTRVINHSDMGMPIFLGFHTTFNVPFADGSADENVAVFAEVAEEIERDMATYLPTGRILPPDRITREFTRGEFRLQHDKISRHYKACGSGAIELHDTAQKIKLVYENDAAFAWRLFYNGTGGPYICLEPQTCMVDCQNKAEREAMGFVHIPPHEALEYTSRIRVEEIL